MGVTGVPGAARNGAKVAFGFGERVQKALRAPSKASRRMWPWAALLATSNDFPSFENSSFVHVGSGLGCCSRERRSKVAKGGLSKFRMS